MATLVGGKASMESWEPQCLSLLSPKEHCLTEDAQAVTHKHLT